jgi:hypothetical protein
MKRLAAILLTATALMHLPLIVEAGASAAALVARIAQTGVVGVAAVTALATATALGALWATLGHDPLDSP